MTTQSAPSHGRSSTLTPAINDSNQAALLGAAVAFRKPHLPPKPTPDLEVARRRNRAPVVASKTDNTGSRTDGPMQEIRQQPGRSGRNSSGVPEHVVARRPSGHLVTDPSGRLKVPREVSLDRTVSASFIAATLAASRSAPVSPNHTGQQASSPMPKPRSGKRSPSSVRSSRRNSYAPSDGLDTRSIPPTTSLIGMFENSESTSAIDPPSASATKRRAPPPEIKSPKPIRAQTVAARPERAILSKITPSLLHESSDDRASTPSIKTVSSVLPDEDDDTSSDDTFVSASDKAPNRALGVAPKRRLYSISPSSNNAQSTAMIIDAMANAIVASSLASTRSRDTSPTKSIAPPPLPRRNLQGHYSKNPLFHNSRTLDTRTPSPAKGFRTTMRKPKREDEEEDEKHSSIARMGKKNLMKKHPNKHHEGDRKRWRDAITERERKRYEAVWASNRGLFIDSVGQETVKASIATPARTGTSSSSGLRGENGEERLSECVSNIVVRDIWSRSRLGDDVLGEVWELVDRTGVGKLSKEEFVTGLWLIDQRLKGRKLPMRVSDSVWNSAGNLAGIKVKSKR